MEFGSGYFSTTMLHKYSLEFHRGKRQILTADTKEDWLSKFYKYKTNFHNFRHINPANNGKEWDTVAANCSKFQYGIIFLDHAPGERRVVDLERLCNCSKLIVLHDTEVRNIYHYMPGIRKYRYRYESLEFGAGTMVLSNFASGIVNKASQLIEWYSEEFGV